MSDHLKPNVLDLLVEARRAHVAFMDGLTEAQRAEVGTLEHWSAKDLMGHLIFWQANQCRRTLIAARGEKPPTFDNFLELNDENYHTRREHTWEQVRTEFHTGMDALTAAVQVLPDELLHQKLTGDFPFWMSIVGNAYQHPMAHFAEYALAHGDLAKATALEEAAFQHTSALQEDGPARGQGLYNLACFYAKTGQHVRALELLPDALRLLPDLHGWAQQDSDLDSLRTEPGYRALFPAAE